MGTCEHGNQFRITQQVKNFWTGWTTITSSNKNTYLGVSY